VIASAAEVYDPEPVIHPIAGGSGPLDLFVGELDLPVVSASE
jgi:hypothetical protein